MKYDNDCTSLKASTQVPFPPGRKMTHRLGSWYPTFPISSQLQQPETVAVHRWWHTDELNAPSLSGCLGINADKWGGKWLLCYSVVPLVSRGKSVLMTAVGDTQVTTAYSPLQPPAADRKAVLALITKQGFSLLSFFSSACRREIPSQTHKSCLSSFYTKKLHFFHHRICPGWFMLTHY